jgi:predicted AAA+ superfamily ATPase
MKIKLIVDNIPDIQVVATGSSAFELTSKINESLTGRKVEFQMFPLTFKEMVSHTNLLDELRMIPHRLVYGYYPEIVCNPGKESILLQEITNSYLYKDILSLDSIHKPDKLVKLLKAIALQIGSQVSYNELSQLVGLDLKTVDRYIDVLEKAYIVFRLGSFSRNLRNELKSSRKIYFWDLGIRNALIGNLNQIENRNDIGALWENYVISERLKRNLYEFSYAQSWFWRTQQQQEIDYVEDKDGHLSAYEIKWNASKGRAKLPQSFANTYPDANYQVITPENIESFLL